LFGGVGITEISAPAHARFRRELLIARARLGGAAFPLARCHLQLIADADVAPDLVPNQRLGDLFLIEAGDGAAERDLSLLNMADNAPHRRSSNRSAIERRGLSPDACVTWAMPDEDGMLAALAAAWVGEYSTVAA
jgi:hypothetical protein